MGCPILLLWDFPGIVQTGNPAEPGELPELRKPNRMRSQQPAVTEQHAGVKELGDYSRYSAEHSSAHACEGTPRPTNNHRK